VYHVIHQDDLNIALKYTCDYRRYNWNMNFNVGKQPKFYSDIQNLVSIYSNLSNTKKILLVLSKISGNTVTQCDYYIQYVVDISMTIF